MKWDHCLYQNYHYRKKEYVSNQKTYTELYNIHHFINFDSADQEYRADFKTGRIALKNGLGVDYSPQHDEKDKHQ